MESTSFSSDDIVVMAEIKKEKEQTGMETANIVLERRDGRVQHNDPGTQILPSEILAVFYNVSRTIKRTSLSTSSTFGEGENKSHRAG